MPQPTVPRWPARIISELDHADARATALTKGLSTEQLDWSSRPGEWSIGQCLAHLCLSNEVYVQPIAEALKTPPTGPVDEITPGWFGRWFIRRYIEPMTQKTKARAPRKAAPVVNHVDASILDRFIASNRGIREIVARAERHDVNRVRFKNPYVGVIRFTVGTGIQILARHNHRHLLQAERVKQSPAFPRGTPSRP